jgi:hypothetical protein
MKTYANLGRDSGILSYDYDEGSITIVFKHGGSYRYSASRIGASHFAELKRLADSGDGLNTYINQNDSVKFGYDPR